MKRAPTATQTGSEQIKDRNPEGVEANVSGDRPIVIGRHPDGSHCYHADICHLVERDLDNALSKGASAHTPGPWHVSYGTNDLGIYPESGKIIAVVKDKNANAANARLIAAAPETAAALDKLLHAARKIEARSHWSDEVHGYVVDKGAMDNLCAVIGKMKAGL